MLLARFQAPSGRDSLWREVAVAITRDFIKQPVDELPPNSQLHGWVKEIFFKLEWFEVYDLIEFVVDNVPLGRPPEHSRQAVNEILECEASGYRFVAGSLAPISSEVELEAIDGAVDAADDQGLSAVSGHIRTAVAKLRERPNADYRNAIKEATSAVESAAKLVTGIERGGLKPALENLAQRAHLHEALRDGLVKLYGYASDEDGVRHAAFASLSRT